MNWKYIIVPVLIGSAAYGGYRLYKYYGQQKELLQDYEVSLIGLRFSSLSEGLITGDLKLRIKNKSDVEATVEEVFTAVYLNGEYMGNVKSSSQFVIPAKGVNDISLNFSLAGKELLKNIVSSILAALTTKDIGYKLEGYAKMKSSFVTVSVPFNYAGNVRQDMLGSGTTVAN